MRLKAVTIIFEGKLLTKNYGEKQIKRTKIESYSYYFTKLVNDSIDMSHRLISSNTQIILYPIFKKLL